MKKSIIVYVLCSCLVMVHIMASPICSSATTPASCQECSIRKLSKEKCEVKCTSCHCTDGTIGPADTKIQFERSGSEDIEITVDENGELEITE